MGAIVSVTLPGQNVDLSIKGKLEKELSKVTGEPVTVNINVIHK